jgi:HPr kinase/phosphorylase
MGQKTQYSSSSEPAEKTVFHGVFLDIHGLGVLLTGDSGVGKSELALELISRSHCLIADCDFLEVRGLGVLNIRAMYGDGVIKSGKDLCLIVHLERMAPEKIQQVDRLEGSYSQQDILGIEIPMVTLPVTSGRNLAVLVEAAVRHHILLRKGYNASDEFITRQQHIIQQQHKHQNPGKE